MRFIQTEDGDYVNINTIKRAYTVIDAEEDCVKIELVVDQVEIDDTIGPIVLYQRFDVEAEAKCELEALIAQIEGNG